MMKRLSRMKYGETELDVGMRLFAMESRLAWSGETHDSCI